MADTRAINTSAPFKYRDAILAAFREGGTCRADVRALRADELLGTYLIRLRIALDPALNGGLSKVRNSAAQDLRHLTEALRRAGAAGVQAFYVHAPEGVAYDVFQSDDGGEHLGCLRRERQEAEPPNRR